MRLLWPMTKVGQSKTKRKSVHSWKHDTTAPNQPDLWNHSSQAPNRCTCTPPLMDARTDKSGCFFPRVKLLTYLFQMQRMCLLQPLRQLPRGSCRVTYGISNASFDVQRSSKRRTDTWCISLIWWTCRVHHFGWMLHHKPCSILQMFIQVLAGEDNKLTWEWHTNPNSSVVPSWASQNCQGPYQYPVGHDWQ